MKQNLICFKIKTNYLTTATKTWICPLWHEGEEAIENARGRISGKISKILSSGIFLQVRWKSYDKIFLSSLSSGLAEH